jgi:hypothetical protein
MKIAIHVTEKVMHQWPIDYWAEFIRKATKNGHEVYAFSGEPNVVIQLKNDHVFDRTQVCDEDARREIASCDVFVGPLLHFYGLAPKNVGILTSSFAGEGVRATIPCAGCRESLGERVDCHWGDELCQWHVTPNDVLKAAGL